MSPKERRGRVNLEMRVGGEVNRRRLATSEGVGEIWDDGSSLMEKQGLGRRPIMLSKRRRWPPKGIGGVDRWQRR